MQFTTEHEELRHTLKQFIENEINPHVDAWEAEKIFPAHDVFKKLGALGLLGISKPEKYGGAGLDFSYSMVMAEELGHINCGAVPMAIGVHTDMATPALTQFGSDALKQEFLEPSIKGDVVACLGVSEPGAGSDVANIQTTAKKSGDDLIINGSKMWITNSTQADWMCLLANTSDGPAHKNKSLICVQMDTKGVEVAPKLEKLGMWSSDTAQVFFDDVKIPYRNIIGEEGQGFIYQMQQFQQERMWTAANSLCAMENLIQATITHTSQRQAFGKSILDNQVVQFRLAELQTEIEALRSLVYRACEDFIHGQEVTQLASMAKLKTGRLMREVADSCLQYWGGMGYMWESMPARNLRDWRLLSIGAGADEVMLGIIARQMV